MAKISIEGNRAAGVAAGSGVKTRAFLLRGVSCAGCAGMAKATYQRR